MKHEFVKNNPDLMITKADKGNKTIIEKDDYVQKVELWSEANINDYLKNYFKCKNDAPRSCGLIKLHKQNHLIRP